MKKHITHIATALILVAAQLLVLSACADYSNGATDNGLTTDPPNGTTGTRPIPDSPQAAEDGADIITEVDRSAFYGETLTIALPHDLGIGPFVALYMRNNPGVTIELVIDPNWHVDRQDFRTRMAAQIMAGSGPVLISDIFLDDLDPRMAPFFVDWFTLMDADPDFNEDEWFMNVFEAFSVGGKLYSFPRNFDHFMLSVNTTIDGLYEAFNEAFSVYSGITTDQMLDFYRNFPTDTHYWVDPTFDFRWIARNYLDYFMDLESGWVDFDNERFISLITNMRDLIDTDEVAPTLLVMEEAWSQRYFYFPLIVTNPLFILDMDPPRLFRGRTPITNESGELLVRSTCSYILNANASPIQQALAWDFIMFTMDMENFRMGDTFPAFDISTNRNFVVYDVEEFSERFFENAMLWDGPQLVGSLDEAKEELISLRTMFGDMPMTRRYNAPRAIQDILDAELQSFLDGHTTVEQTAADIQSRVELVMMEMG